MDNNNYKEQKKLKTEQQRPSGPLNLSLSLPLTHQPLVPPPVQLSLSLPLQTFLNPPPPLQHTTTFHLSTQIGGGSIINTSSSSSSSSIGGGSGVGSSSSAMQVDDLPSPVTIVFPHMTGEIGLQQRTAVSVKTDYGFVPVGFHIRAVDTVGEELKLCSKVKKDHNCVIKTLNTELFVGGGKADVTFYCKGSKGGCKTKRPSKVRLHTTLSYENGHVQGYYSSTFLVRGNRRQTAPNRASSRYNNAFEYDCPTPIPVIPSDASSFSTSPTIGTTTSARNFQRYANTTDSIQASTTITTTTTMTTTHSTGGGSGGGVKVFPKIEESILPCPLVSTSRNLVSPIAITSSTTMGVHSYPQPIKEETGFRPFVSLSAGTEELKFEKTEGCRTVTSSSGSSGDIFSSGSEGQFGSGSGGGGGCGVSSVGNFQSPLEVVEKREFVVVMPSLPLSTMPLYKSRGSGGSPPVSGVGGVDLFLSNPDDLTSPNKKRSRSPPPTQPPQQQQLQFAHQAFEQQHIYQTQQLQQYSNMPYSIKGDYDLSKHSFSPPHLHQQHHQHLLSIKPEQYLFDRHVKHEQKGQQRQEDYEDDDDTELDLHIKPEQQQQQPQQMQDAKKMAISNLLNPEDFTTTTITTCTPPKNDNSSHRNRNDHHNEKT